MQAKELINFAGAAVTKHASKAGRNEQYSTSNLELAIDQSQSDAFRDRTDEDAKAGREQYEKARLQEYDRARLDLQAKGQAISKKHNEDLLDDSAVG